MEPIADNNHEGRNKRPWAGADVALIRQEVTELLSGHPSPQKLTLPAAEVTCLRERRAVLGAAASRGHHW